MTLGLTNPRWDKAEKALQLGAQRPNFTRNHRHGEFIWPLPSMDFLLTSRLIIVNQLQETTDS